jgi:murein DD-endopeptidase MepM/ murein hydrolase activator NlpD
MRRRRSAIAPLALVLAAALAVAGCSRGGSPPPAATAAPSTSGGGTGSTAAGQPGAAPGSSTSRPAPTPLRYRFPVAGCRADYGRSHHDYPATDIFAARGCTFVSPVDGRVDEVARVDHWSASRDRGADRGGRAVSVVGVDGVRYYGSHLESVAAGIAPGVRVRAGQPLGRVGNSGSARVTPVHLHFGLSWPTRPGIWWVRRGVVYPWRYLDSWRAGGNLSPARAVRAARATAGREVPPCQVRC